MRYMSKGTRVYHKDGLNTGTVTRGGFFTVIVYWDHANKSEKCRTAELGPEREL